MAPGAGAASQPDPVVVKKNQAGAAPTPVQQGTSDVDLMITQQIRKAVTADSVLSATAKNIEIITQGGKVTLRGVVKRDEERHSIDASARKVAGSGNVDNQLEVTK
jgi:osmotically-inducible protein OsmY